MKRKIIQIGQTSKIVSLPKEWVDRNKLTKSSEVNVNVIENRVIIENPLANEVLEKEYNIDGYDRTSIQLLIRAAYFANVSKLILKFSKKNFLHIRENIEKDIEKIINEELMRISGYTLIDIDNSHGVIESLSHENPEDIHTFYNNALASFTELLSYIKKTDFDEINVEGYHNKITLFLNVASRNILKYHIADPKFLTYYNIVRELDILLDIYKYFFRYYRTIKADETDTKKILFPLVDFTNNLLLFLKSPDYKKASEIYEAKEDVKKILITKLASDPKLNFLHGYLCAIPELSLNIILSRMTLTQFEEENS